MVEHNYVVAFQNSLLAAHKGVCKGTLIDDSVWPEENDIRRRFLSDESPSLTLLILFMNVLLRSIGQYIFFKQFYSLPFPCSTFMLQMVYVYN